MLNDSKALQETSWILLTSDRLQNAIDDILSSQLIPRKGLVAVFTATDKSCELLHLFESCEMKKKSLQKIINPLSHGLWEGMNLQIER